MGFTIATFRLYGLPSLCNIYVTIKGSYTIKKEELLNSYNISFIVYYQASQNDPVITQREMSFIIQSLPNPAVLYNIIYDYIKGQLDPFYNTPEQTLTFIDG